MEAQGYPIHENQDNKNNKSAILLEKNGWKSAGKRSRALTGDYMTKPLQGMKFHKFRNEIMGL